MKYELDARTIYAGYMEHGPDIAEKTFERIVKTKKYGPLEQKNLLEEATALIFPYKKNPARNKKSFVQSFIFSRKKFNWTEALNWLVKHGYKHGKMEFSDKYLHVRQLNPNLFKRIRTIKFAPGIEARIGFR